MNKLINIVIKLPVILCLFLLASTASAANYNTANTTIGSIETLNGNTTFVKTAETGLTNPAECTSKSGLYTLESTASEWSRSLLLSAYVSGRKVRLVIYGEACKYNRPLIVAIRLQD
jgi:hypothetical protein